jgi:hypothetical protein|tara:strand:+ start:820 stop:1032 length:213 start_codon:yes stop_codon:yes gene_type:complete
MGKSSSSSGTYTNSPNEVKIGGGTPSKGSFSGASNQGAREGDQSGGKSDGGSGKPGNPGKPDRMSDGGGY